MSKTTNTITLIIDFLTGLLLIAIGSISVFLYFCMRSKADNWFISFAMILFLVGLGITAIIVGIRRIFITIIGRKTEGKGDALLL